MVVIIAIVCVLLVSLIGASLLRLAITHQRQVRREHARAQADWLAEAGLNRAAARLATDPDYSGETWEITPDQFHGRGDGTVTISIDRAAGDAPAVTAVADFPRDPPARARSTRRVTISRAAPAPDRD